MKSWKLEVGSWNFKKTARLAVLLIFFLSTLSLSVGTYFFNSPDENANFVFAAQYASERTFLIFDYINNSLDFGSIVHPRSTVVLNPYITTPFIVPGSFLGLPFVAGIVGSLFGEKSMFLVTPILAVLAILSWRSLMLKFTKDERSADLSALFLIIHPAFWLYSARVMMHNVGFVALLIFGAWVMFTKPFKRDWLNWFGGGLFIGLALCFRTSEVIWVSVIVLSLLIIYKKSFTWKKFSAFVLAFVMILSGLSVLNYATYDSPFKTGYTIENNSSLNSETENDELRIEANREKAVDEIVETLPLSKFLLPFGFHERNIINNVWAYGFLLYPWMTVLAIIGFIFVVRDKEWREYILITLGLSIWLAVVYGSWKFNDNPDASVITLGNSYVRYWLPLFVLGSAFCAVGVQKISELVKNKWQTVIKVTIVTLMTVSSGMLVLFGEDGLLKTRQSLANIQAKHDIIIEQTPEDSIIIVDMADKYLWPDRRVVTPLRSEVTYASIPKMLELTDVYYFGITFPESDINYLNDIKLKKLGAQIEEIVEIGDETLYQIKND